MTQTTIYVMDQQQEMRMVAVQVVVSSGGQNAIQKITFAPAVQSGVFDLVFGGYTTSDINAATANYSTIQTALEALTSIGSGNILVTGDWTGYYCEFEGSLANTAEANMTVVNNSLVAADNAIGVTTTTIYAAGGLVMDGATIVATASDAGLSDGTTAFRLIYTAQFTDTTSPQSVINWGTYSGSAVSIFAPGVYSGAWFCTNGSDAFAAGTADTASHVFQWDWDGSANLTLTVDGTLVSTQAYSLGMTLSGAVGLAFGGIPGLWFAAGVLSGVQFYDASLTLVFSWTFNGTGTETVSGNDATITGTCNTFSNQTDTISLDSHVSGGDFELGGTTGIACNDDGSGVQSAYDTWATANSYSAATIAKTDAGTYTVAYATPGDQTAVTAALAAATFGDTLVQPVTVTVATTQIGG